MKKVLIAFLGVSLFSCSLWAMSSKSDADKNKEISVITKKVEYDVSGKTHHGYLYKPSQMEGKAPGVLVVHEWWGLNDYAKSRAKKLAQLGYVAFAIDMYGEGKQAEHPKEAKKFSKMAMSNFKLAQKRFDRALEILKSQPDVSEETAAIGYCFGGSVVLNMAFAGSDLDLVASFHGSLSEKMKVADSTNLSDTKIFIFNGAADSFVTDKQIEHVKTTVSNTEANLNFYNLKNAKHSFTNPKADKLGEKFDLPLAYNKKADEKSWSVLKSELKKLKK